MKKLSTLVLGLLTCGMAWADIRIDEVLVRRKEGVMNIRVNLTNPSSKAQKGPIVITLYARPNAEAEWEQIKVWNNIGKLGPGYRVARDFFDKNNPRLAEIASEPAFEARAVVKAPGCPTQEEIGVFHPDP
jgi:hypothetical protein